jgi:hypothetical protein
MTVDADAELAMILPLPVRPGSGDSAIRFFDLSGYVGFFDDLDKGKLRWMAREDRSDRSHIADAPRPGLVVHEVGGFDASFAPTLGDLDRLDRRFTLPREVWRGLPQYSDFGFAVFKLRSGAQTVHPMAFSFPTRQSDALFFPTIHLHDGHDVPRIAAFDHTLWFQGETGRDFQVWKRYMAKVTKTGRWEGTSDIARGFMDADTLPPGLVDLLDYCFWKRLEGPHPNRDVQLVRGEDGLMGEADDVSLNTV